MVDISGEELNPEFELPLPNEFAINQEVKPFLENYTVDDHDGDADRLPSYDAMRTLILPTENGDVHLPIEFSMYVATDDGLYIIPFHPESGYTIDQRDFNLESRRAKLQQYMHKDTPNENYPYILYIYIHPNTLRDLGIITIGEDGFNASPGQNAHILDQLRCVVRANGTYLSRGE
ncbi:MAG: hypothetical protein ABIO02_01225, partial [Patescibacteria group bacterium]